MLLLDRDIRVAKPEW